MTKAAATDPTCVVVSQRALSRELSRCYGYELEDVLVGLTGGRLVAPTPRRSFGGRGAAAEKVVNQIRRRTKGRVTPPSGLTVDAPGPVADVLYAHVQLFRDVPSMRALGDLARWATVSVCYIEEVWARDLRSMAPFVADLEAFDHVFIGVEGTVGPLSEALSTPVSYLPYSVDTLVFAPSARRERWIDVTNIGRRSPVTHAALYEWSASGERFYYYDSARPLEFKSASEHRRMLARLLGASKISISNRGVGAEPAAGGGWEEALPARYFEAAAAGAVLVGAPPELPGMAEHFGWTDAVVPMDFDEPDAGAVIEAMLVDPDRLAAASQANIVGCLDAHDHLHRLTVMLGAVGVELGPSARARAEALAERRAQHA